MPSWPRSRLKSTRAHHLWQIPVPQGWLCPHAVGVAPRALSILILISIIAAGSAARLWEGTACHWRGQMRRGAGPLGTETDSASPVLVLPGGQLLPRVSTFLEQKTTAAWDALEGESVVTQPCPTLCNPHGLWPTKLLCPWDSPGKNTGVVATTSSRGISQPRNQTPGSYVSCIGRRVLYH